MCHLIIYYAVFTVIQLKEKPIMTITTSVIFYTGSLFWLYQGYENYIF